MAKKKNDKVRPKKTGKNSKDDLSDSDSVLNDTSSVTSGFSCTSSKFDLDESFCKDQDVDDEVIEIDDFEAKLDLVFEGIQSAKSSKARLMHYESLAKALTTRYCYDYLDNRKISIQDNIEHGLKKSGEEAGAAAVALSLTLITMGTSDFSDEIFRSVYNQLNKIFMDHTAKPHVRAKCATALSFGCFITDYGMEKTRELLYQLLSMSFNLVKENGDSNQLNLIYDLKATCLDLFSFLISVESWSFISDCLTENIEKLSTCLESTNLNLRVAAGECIAFLFEKSMEFDEEFELDSIDDLCEKIQSLATEYQKSRSKKELRQQRSNFRQILRTIECDSFSTETVKFGMERLTIDSWQLKRYYDSFCGILGSGMNLHLAQNILLRDIFNLGPVSLDNNRLSKVSKIEKQYINNFNKKARELSRGRMRSKRSDFDL